MTVLFQDVGQGIINCLLIKRFPFIEGKNVVEDIVHVKSITIKQIIAISNNLLRHYLPCPAELAYNEIDVSVLGYPVQKNRLGTVVEWLRVGLEHLLQNMSVASRENEVAVVHFLNMGPKQLFHHFILVFSNLLKLVYGEDAWLVGLFQIGEYLFESKLRRVNISQLEFSYKIRSITTQSHGLNPVIFSEYNHPKKVKTL